MSTAAIAELRGGRAIVVPTDTVYGLAALPAHVDVLYELKQRPADMPIAHLVADTEQAFTMAEPTDPVRRLAARFWPGPLTIVWAGVGVRCPDSELVRSLARVVGPIATTSANLHGQPTPTTAAEAAEVFPTVSVVLDGGALPGSASTVVRVDGGLEVLREGPITSAAVQAVVDSRP